MDVPRLRRVLLRWFARSKRPLPWRQTRDPYAIWVSEVMLQQTTVAAVIPYYARFMARFPTILSLATGDEDAVLEMWSGLGYYARARNLRLGAQVLARNHNGTFPRDVETAMTIKGVGRYTASAVTSLAYGARVAAVDGNVFRVLSRLYAARDLTSPRAQQLATNLLSARAPGAWNEAMMELGATVCLPKRPRCQTCPVRTDCEGRSRPESWGGGRPRRATIKTMVEMALVIRSDRVLLVRTPTGDLMGGLYELPHAGLPGQEEACMALRDRYRGRLRVAPEAVTTIRHAVTHHRIEALIFRARLLKLPSGDAIFQPRGALSRLPLGGLTRKALRAVGIPV
ncbi:MAG: A/G-specific adenine glycosylase [Vicinamibacteria bacterium]|nr:A/G-specific adenine glycosylase [Vicinamibacteria bacterium]